MAQKRPYDNEVVNEVSSKHPRQDEPSDEIISRNNSFSNEGESGKPYDSGEASIGKSELEFRGEHENGSCPEIHRGGTIQDIEIEVPRCASLSQWVTSSTSDEDEELINLPFFPGYFSFDRPVRSAIDPDDLYYCLLDYPPRKRVPVGPEHQADIPAGWGALNSSSDGLPDGICIMSSPSESELEKVGDLFHGRTECSCVDKGSIRCVQQHITEARDRLKRSLGEDAFMELGFCDMGEIVARKWSEKDEQLFHEVVFSNPASLGKNFWNVLSAVFPSRTKMEIVSYYFNVFMLRKRAEQNRHDPMNIDSDNDEWQRNDDDDDDEEEEGDDDSGIESPVHHENVLHGHGHGHDDDDDDGDDDDDDDDDGNNDDGFVQKTTDHDSFIELPVGKKSDDDDGCENYVQDGSCTSSDSQGTTQLKPDGCQEWHEYILESSDAKPWDGYNNISCPKNNMDFLPTCSMIEEVFGDGDFDSEGKNRC